MQPSKELKGLVESYGQVGATDYQERKELERTVVNTIGVHMVSEGYTEDDVKEFLKTASAGKVVERFEESLENETATAYITEEGKFDTKLRYVEGAIHARLNEVKLNIFQTDPKTDLAKRAHDAVGRFTKRVAGALSRFGRGGVGTTGDALGGRPTRSEPTDAQKNAKLQQQKKETEQASRPKPEPTGERSAAANREKQEKAKKEAEAQRQAQTRQKDTAPATPSGSTMSDVKPKKVSATHTYKKHGSDLHVGRHKTLAQHRAAVAAQKAKKNEEVEVKEDLGKALNTLSKKLKTSDHPAAKAARALVTPVGAGRGTARPSVQVQDRIRKNQAGMESVDVELVTSFLVSEGFSDTPEGALIMLEGMSESWFNDILDVRRIEEAMIEYLQVMGEAESRDEALYIISEMDEEAIDILAEQVEEIMEKKVYTVTDLDKKGNTEAWKRYQQGNPQYKYGGLKGV